jgi:threonine-phosphate decarboxylase
MIRGHGGNIDELARVLDCPPEAIIDMSSNVNPFGPPNGLLSHLRRRLFRIGALPEVDGYSAVERFSAHWGIPAEEVAIGNGTTQLIYDLPRALRARRALIVGPTYADYRDGCLRNQVDCDFWLAREESAFQLDEAGIRDVLSGFDTIYVCNPNNPTGTLVPRETLKTLSRQFPDKQFVIDESYLPFVENPETVSLLAERPSNVVVLHSMSKIFRIPGLRIGFAVGETGIVRRLRDRALPWNVNSLALEALHYLLDEGEAGTMERFVQETRTRLAEERTAMRAHLAGVQGIRVFPSTTGFFLIRLPEAYRSETVCQQLAKEGILVRDCANFEGLTDRFLRISLQDRATNQKCATILARLLTR